MFLSGGQEMMFNIRLPKKQRLSFRYKSKAQIFDASAATKVYSPVAHKKGEIFVMLEFQGGLARATAGTQVMLESCQLAVYVTRKFTASILGFSSNQTMYDHDAINTLGTVIAANEIDVVADDLNG